MLHKLCKFPSTETFSLCKLTLLQFQFWEEIDSFFSKIYLCEVCHDIIIIWNSVYRFDMWIIHILPTYSHFTASVCRLALISFVELSNVYFLLSMPVFILSSIYTISLHRILTLSHCLSWIRFILWVSKFPSFFFHTKFHRNFSCHIQLLFITTLPFLSHLKVNI